MIRSLRKWADAFVRSGSDVQDGLRDVYGDRDEIVGDRLSRYRVLIHKAAQAFGEDADAGVIRVPGRINLMGVHTDSQYSYKNYLAFQREVLTIVRPRNDDRVTMQNVDPHFAERAFRIGEELPPERRGRWTDYILDTDIIPGDWSNYVRAGVLVLQDRFPDRELKGMDLFISGDIPLSAGLSSSSALTVASLLAAAEVNHLELDRGEQARLSGIGEWYVGTRGGSGDQAAQMFCRRDRVLHIRFTPEHFEPFDYEYLPFLSDDVQVVIANSMKQARKAAEAKQRPIVCAVSQALGTMFIRDDLGYEMNLLCELNAPPYELDGPATYELLRALPERIGRTEAIRRLSKRERELQRLFRTHEEPTEGYPVRDVCFYLMAECQRGARASEFLNAGDMEGFGAMMTGAHDGDRVARYDPETGRTRRWEHPTSDAMLDELIRQNAALILQPGAFSCSCEELDRLVDISLNVEGVLGARLTGAGLGGCMVILVHRNRVPALLDELDQKYYRPEGHPLSAEVAVPVAGGGIVLGRE